MRFKKGDIVLIRDYPLGRPLSVWGTVVGTVGLEYYNVLMANGMCEGKIIRYKYWKLLSKEEGR